MNIEKGEEYLDRTGTAWRVIDVDGPRIAPITAARWEGGNTYRTRTYQRDGSYFHDREDRWDLITKVEYE